MDLIHAFMNFLIDPAALIALFNILNTYLFLKGVSSTLRTIFCEDVSGKVILITGASSGIGEHLAYEYARRGACLALVARRENRLREVGAIAELIGSPEAIIIPGDVTKVEDCERSITATVKHFGRLDHLVANAGAAHLRAFEDIPDITKYARTMDVNFWGSVNIAYFAIPHLKMSNGRIIVMASVAAWIPAPRLSFYNASKAALYSMYETLRIELGSEIGITIISPGLIKSEMTGGKFLKIGKLKVDEEMLKALMILMPLESTAACAKAILNSVCRGDKCLTEPAWYCSFFHLKVFCPDLLEWSNRLFFMVTRSILKI